ncbi:acyl carrier protein [Kribbella sp. NPDC050820]|uniref:acyl carrier protein n=1 Tax=Kribbella sp. NPDC050820 TaxID=3155408 RepID=UPI003405E1E0
MVTEIRADGGLDSEAAESRFLQIVGEVLGVDPVPPDRHFLEIGGDSLSMAIVIDWVAQEFAVEPELDWFFEIDTIGDVARRWSEKRAAS